MNRFYTVLRNLCWAFGADLLFFVILVISGLLEHSVPICISEVIFAVGWGGGFVALSFGTSLAVGLGLTRPIGKDVVPKTWVALLGVASGVFILLALAYAYFIMPHVVCCQTVRFEQKRFVNSKSVETRMNRGETGPSARDASQAANAMILAEQADTLRRDLRRKFDLRNAKDVDVYGKETAREIERIYQTYAQGNEVESEELKTLLEKYSDANRTGCAVMYAGQRAGKEDEKWFRLAIEKSSDCYYGDGVCVGAYARWYLAGLYKELGKTEEAEKLISEIKALYPDAVNHRGRPLAVSLGR